MSKDIRDSLLVAANSIMDRTSAVKDIKDMSLPRRNMMSFFGASLSTCVALWNICNFKGKKVQPKHLLWTMMFLKTYTSENVLARIAGTTPKTFRKWKFVVVEEISSNMHKVVSK